MVASISLGNLDKVLMVFYFNDLLFGISQRKGFLLFMINVVHSFENKVKSVVCVG